MSVRIRTSRHHGIAASAQRRFSASPGVGPHPRIADSAHRPVSVRILASPIQRIARCRRILASPHPRIADSAHRPVSVPSSHRALPRIALSRASRIAPSRYRPPSIPDPACSRASRPSRPSRIALSRASPALDPQALIRPSRHRGIAT
jgi:hypothetical protein